MNILIDGNFPIKILPRKKQIMLQVFLPMLFFPQMLEFLSSCWKNLMKPHLTSKVLKEDLNCTYCSTVMPSLNCSGKWMDCKLALTSALWNKLWLMDDVGFWSRQSVCILRKWCGSVDSRAKAPDQDAWTALGKCFQLEPTVFPLLFYLMGI